MQFIDGLYSSEQVDAYRFAQEELSPHVFGIAAAAYKGLIEDSHSQAIIISGESGAGKTEATKKCLQFFAQVAAGGEAGMDQKLLAANPILEAFGNAKTVRNNNSSRFGKWMEVQFSLSGGIIGCRIVNYLLEKSRIVHPAGEERSYHIFYNLFVGLGSAKKAALHLTTPADFEYLRHASTTISGSSKRDAEDFTDVLDAFNEVGMSAEEYSTLFRLAAAVLHLGSIVFQVHDTPDGSEGSAMLPSAHVDAAAELLGVSTDAMGLELTSRVRVAGGDTMRSPLVPAKAADARDALAKAIYGRMFDWLVLRVNQAMHTTETVGGIIGVLDIFGFEIFDTNVFEQLCINFCNEMLQQHFNTHVFKVEEQLYIDEGIDYSNVEFIDNQDVLDLIQKRPAGILPMLDDEVKLPRGSDANFLARINKAHTGHSRFLVLKAGASGNKVVDTELGKDAGRCGDLPFAVKHYAGGVVYECSGWLNKNKDEIMPNHAQLMVSSTDPFLSSVLFGGDEGMPAFENSPGTPNAAAAAGAGAGKSKAKTQAGKFRSQLMALRETLDANKPHYIRCIKPNSVKKPAIWHGQLCLQQLRYSGIFEAVRIRQQGFPFRFTFRDFYGKYASVVDISPEEAAALGPSAIPRGGAFPSTQQNNRRKYRPVPKERYRAAPWAHKTVSKAPRSDSFYRSMCAAIMQKMGEVDDSAVASAFHGLAVQSGHSMQFYQAAAHHQLTKRRVAVRSSAALDLQTALRRFSSRLRVQRGLEALQRVRAVRSIRTLEALDEAVSAWDAARAACRLQDLAEVAEVRALRDRLQAEADCRAECQELLQLNPTKEYERFLRVVQQAEDFGLSGGAVDAAKAKFQSVRAYYQAKDDLKQGCAQHDKHKIQAAKAAAVTLHAMWGNVFDDTELQRADAALAAIADEETRLQPLVQAMATGSITQEAAADFCSCAVGPQLGGVAWDNVGAHARSLLAVSGSHVQDHLSLLGSGAGLLTPTGRALAQAARGVVAARSSIQSAVRAGGAAPTVDNALAALTVLQEALPTSELSEMPEELQREVRAAHATHLNLQHCRALAAAVSRGGPTGRCGELDLSKVNSETLMKRSAEAHAAFQPPAAGASAASPSMCSALNRLVQTAAALCPLRSALAKRDWNTVRGLLSTIDGIDSTVPCAQTEVHIAFDEIDNLDLLAACSAAFVVPCAAGKPGSVDVAAADDSVARADAALSTGTEPKSRAAEEQLAFISAVLRPLRRAAGERDWAEVRRQLQPITAAALRSQGGSTPTQAGALDSALHRVMQSPLDMGDGSGTHTVIHQDCFAELSLLCAQSLHSATLQALAWGIAHGRLVGLPGSIAVHGSSGSSASMHTPAQEAALHAWAYQLQAAKQLQGTTVQSGSARRQSVSLGATPWGSSFTAFPAVAVSPTRALEAVSVVQQHGALSACAESLYSLADSLAQLRQKVQGGQWNPCASFAKALLQSSEKLASIPELARRSYVEIPDSDEAGADAYTAPPPEWLDALVVAAQSGTHGSEEELQTKLLSCVAVELQTVIDHAQLATASAALANAMKVHGVGGVPGALNVASISAAELQRALSALVSCPGILRGSSLALHGVGTLQVALRHALSAGDWADTQRQLQDAGLYDAEEGAIPGSADCVAVAQGAGSLHGLAAVGVALPEAEAEASAAVAHLNNWRVCSALSRALATHQLVGQPGQLDASHCDGAELQEALSLAGKLGTGSSRARRLQTAAAALMELRAAVEAALEDAASCGSSLHDGAAAGTHSMPASWAAVQAAVRTCQRCCQQEGSAGASDDSSAVTSFTQPLQTLIGQEVSLAARDVADRCSAMALWAALASPGPTGSTGALQPASVQITRLNSALAVVSEQGTFTKPTAGLAGAVQVLLALRSAARASSISELQAVLEKLHAAQSDGSAYGGAALFREPAVSDLVSAELQKYRNECDNAKIMHLLHEAIISGAARGSPAAAQLQGLSQGISQLSAAIHETEDIGPKAPVATELLAAAKHLLSVRRAATDSDWAQLLSLVGAAGEASPLAASAPPAMEREIALLRGEAQYQELCTAVQRALTNNSVSGSAEEIDVSSTGTAALDEAAAQADAWGVASRGLRQALDSAASLRRARAALLMGDLPAARDAVSLSSAATAASTGSSGASSPSRQAAGAHDQSAVSLAGAVSTAAAEMSLVRKYVAHTMSLASIAAALSSGAGMWRAATGDVEPSSVRTDGLRRAAASAVDVDTPPVRFASSLGKALLRVRRGQAQRDLGEVEAGLQDASAIPGVSASLTKGVAGHATSSSPSFSARSKVGVESAVRASIAGVLGRSDALIPGMPDTLSVMDSLASRQVPACTVQELSRARSQIVNSSVLATIRRAVEKGQATGRLGNLNLEALNSQVLQDAEDEAVAALGMHDPSAAVDEALLTLRQLRAVREAVLSGAWNEATQLVGDALAVTSTPLLGGAMAEVRLLHSEALLRSAVAMLGCALVSDGLQGCVAEVSTGNASTQRLEAALAAAEAVPGQVQELTQLVAAARYVRRLRAALSSQDWSAAGGVAGDVSSAPIPGLAADVVPEASKVLYASALAAVSQAVEDWAALPADTPVVQAWAQHPLVVSGAVPLAGCLHLKAALFAAPEFWLARAEALWQSSASALQRAARDGAVSGTAGSVDVSTVSTGQLSSAMQGLADQWGRLLSACGVRGGQLWAAAGLTPPSHAQAADADDTASTEVRNLPPPELLIMLESSRYLVSLRTAVAEDRWGDIHASAGGRPIDGMQAPPTSVHRIAAAECELISTEAGIRATLSQLSAALKSGCARAWVHGAAAGADSAQPVTEALLNSWDSDRGVNSLHMATEVLEDAICAAEAIGLSTSATARLLSTARTMLAMRRAAASGDWSSVAASASVGGDNSNTAAPAVTSLHLFVQAEARLLLSHAANQIAASSLLPHFATACAQGSVGRMELEAVDATPIRLAVQKLAGVPLTAARPRLLMASAHQVAKVRAALGADGAADWHRLGALLQELARKDLAPEALQEMQLVADSHRVHTLEATLRAACARGSGSSESGNASSPTRSTVLVHSSDLARAVKLVQDASTGAPGSAAAGSPAILPARVSLTRPLSLSVSLTRLLRFADALSSARRASADEDWQAVARHLDSIQEQGLDTEAQVAGAEIRNLRRTIADQQCQQQLLRALQEGAISGELGDLDVTPVAAAPLEGAIAAGEQLQAGSSARAASLLATARAVAALRSAVLEEDWEAVAESLPLVQDSPSGSLVTEECQLLRKELDNRRVVAALEHALSTGGVEGDIGALKLDKVQLAPLATAVADTSDLQDQAPRTRGTLRVGRLVLGVRRSLLANDWPRVRAALAPFRAALVASGTGSSADVSDAEEDADAATSAVSFSGVATHGALAELRAVAPDMAQRLKDSLPPNDLAALALAPELVLVLRQIQDSAVVAQLSQALLIGAPRGSPTDLDLSHCDSSKLHAAVQLADTVGVKSAGAHTLSALAVQVAGIRDALLSSEYSRVPQLVSAAVACSGRKSGIPHPQSSSPLAPQAGRSDPFAPLEAWVSNPMREGAAQFELAHTPDGSLARSAEDGLVYTPVILTQSRLPDDVAHVVQRELRLAQAVAALSAVRNVAESCFERGRPGGEPGALQLQHVSLDSLDRTQELITALPPEHTPLHLSITLAAVKAVCSIRRGLLTDDWVAVESGVEQAGEMGADLPSAAAHDVELAVAVMHYRAVVVTGPLPDAIQGGGPPHDPSSVGAMDQWSQALELNALDTGLAHAAAIGCASPAAQSLVRSAAFLRRVRAAAQAQEWELMESLLSTADDAALLQDVLPELDRYRLELAHSRAVAALVSGIETGHGIMTVASQWRQRSKPEVALLKAAAASPGMESTYSSPGSTTSPSTALVCHVEQQVEVEGGHRIDSGQVQLASLDAAIELADDVGMHSDDGAVLLRTAKVLRKLRSCVVHDDLPGLVAALEEARSGPLHSMAHEQLKAMLVEFDDRAVCAELAQALEQGRPSGSGGGALSLSSVSVHPLDKAISYAAAVGTRSHRAETLLLSARVIRTLRWELLHPGSEQRTLQAALGVAEAQALAPEAATELHTVRNDIMASMACVQLRDALSFGSGVVTLRKMLPRSPMPQAGAGDADAFSLGSVQDLSVDVAEVRIDISNVQLTALDDAIESACAVGRHPQQLTVLLSSAQAVRDVRAALLGGDWDEAVELAKQYMEMPHSSISGATMGSTGRWLGAAAGQERLEHDSSGLAHSAREELMGVQRALGLVNARGDAVHALLSATSSADEVQLKHALRRAREVGLEGSDDPTARGAMVSARDKLIMVGKVKAQLSAAIASSHLPSLRAAVQSADEVGYTGQEAQVAAQTADAIQDLLQDSRHAMDELDDASMMDVLRRADSLGIALPESARMRQLLAMPVKDRLHLQLQAAMKSGNVHRIAHTTMGIKRVFFAETSRVFSLSAYPGLRAFHEMAQAAGVSTVDYSAHVDAASHLSHVLMHAASPLKGSLSQLPAHLQSGAVALCTYIAQYCGDQPREFAYPDTVAQELLQLALATPLLRDEVFIQLIRCMTGNHSSDSLQCARQLMFLCCTCFPPSEALENYLEAFLRRAREDACVYALHKTAYTGAVQATPTIAEIRSIIQALHQEAEFGAPTASTQDLISGAHTAAAQLTEGSPAKSRSPEQLLGSPYGRVQAVAPPTAGSVSRSLRFDESGQHQMSSFM